MTFVARLDVASGLEKGSIGQTERTNERSWLLIQVRRRRHEYASPFLENKNFLERRRASKLVSAQAGVRQCIGDGCLERGAYIYNLLT